MIAAVIDISIFAGPGWVIIALEGNGVRLQSTVRDSPLEVVASASHVSGVIVDNA